MYNRNVFSITNSYIHSQTPNYTVWTKPTPYRSPKQRPSSLPNIHGHPGRSGQPLERAWGQPGAGQGTGLIWQPHRTVSVEKKEKSTTTDLHILRLKLNVFGGPGELHLTGSLGRVKPCLEKQRTWEGGTLQLTCCWLADWCKGNRSRKEIREKDVTSGVSFF